MTDKAVNTQEPNETGLVKTEVGVNAPAVVSGNYITQMLADIKEGFVQANAGLDLDFVRMGTFLKISAKGNFVEAKDESVSFGDSMDVVIAAGEQRWSVWGKKETPEDGQLIVACATEKEGREQFGEWLEANPQAQERYTLDGVKLRYIAFLVPVASIKAAAENDDVPSIYLLPFATTDTYEWGAYGMKVYQGKFKALGIPARTAANMVVTRLVTKEKKGKGNDKFIGIDFSPVGLFVPADYGIK